MDASNFITEMKSSPVADLAERWGRIEELYTKKLWHQLTVQLQQIVKLPVMQELELLNKRVLVREAAKKKFFS